jgi:hypothetical protein
MATPADVVAAAVDLVRDWQDDAAGPPSDDRIEVT